MCSFLTKVTLQYNSSPMKGKTGSSSEHSKLLEILDSWARDVNDATTIARQAIVAYVMKEDVNRDNVSSDQGNSWVKPEDCLDYALSFGSSINCLEIKLKEKN